MGEAPSWHEGAARALIGGESGRKGVLLPVLQALQQHFGCIPDPAVPLIAEALNLSRAEVQGVIGFYRDFRREPAGRHVLKLCRGEACRAQGAAAVAEALLRRLGCNWGETSADGELTVEPVYCLGLCACGPAALLDDEPLGRLDSEALKRALAAKEEG